MPSLLDTHTLHTLFITSYTQKTYMPLLLDTHTLQIHTVLFSLPHTFCNNLARGYHTGILCPHTHTHTHTNRFYSVCTHTHAPSFFISHIMSSFSMARGCKHTHTHTHTHKKHCLRTSQHSYVFYLYYYDLTSVETSKPLIHTPVHKPVSLMPSLLST